PPATLRARPRRPIPRPALLPLSLIAALIWMAALTPRGSGADPDRLVPWKAAATPGLALGDLAGRPQRLADLRGRGVLVHFWATWCEPCREELPSMQRLAGGLAGRPLAVAAGTYGGAAPRIDESVGRPRFDLPVLLDPDLAATRAWRVRILPASFLVGGDGRVRYSVVGELD